MTLSVLAIPQTGSPLAQLVADGWTFFEDVSSASEVSFVVKTLKKTAQLPGIEQFSNEQIWSAIEAHRNGAVEIEQSDLKGPEWDVLTAENPPTDYPHFMSKKVGVPSRFEPTITRVLLLERLREANALLGFTRIESPDEGTGDAAVPRAPLGRSAPDWVPATQVHGEGIFIRFNADALKSWADKDAVKSLDARLRLGHRGWRHKRNLDPNEGYPGARYVMLHTLAHMLIRELALECNRASKAFGSFRKCKNGTKDGPNGAKTP